VCETYQHQNQGLVTPKLAPISLILPTFFSWTKTCAIDGPIIFVGSKHSCWELGYALPQFHNNFEIDQSMIVINCMCELVCRCL
jgi:hypothetical protein